MLIEYLRHAEALRQQPEFYNSLTSNTTTILFKLARQIDLDLPLDYRLLASGHFGEYAFDHHALTPGVPYAELQRRGYIDDRALEANGGAISHAPTEADFPGYRRTTCAELAAGSPAACAPSIHTANQVPIEP